MPKPKPQGVAKILGKTLRCELKSKSPTGTSNVILLEGYKAYKVGDVVSLSAGDFLLDSVVNKDKKVGMYGTDGMTLVEITSKVRSRYPEADVVKVGSQYHVINEGDLIGRGSSVIKAWSVAFKAVLSEETHDTIARLASGKPNATAKPSRAVEEDATTLKHAKVYTSERPANPDGEVPVDMVDYEKDLIEAKRVFLECVRDYSLHVKTLDGLDSLKKLYKALATFHNMQHVIEYRGSTGEFLNNGSAETEGRLKYLRMRICTGGWVVPYAIAIACWLRNAYQSIQNQIETEGRLDTDKMWYESFIEHKLEMVPLWYPLMCASENFSNDIMDWCDAVISGNEHLYTFP